MHHVPPVRRRAGIPSPYRVAVEPPAGAQAPPAAGRTPPRAGCSPFPPCGAGRSAPRDGPAPDHLGVPYTPMASGGVVAVIVSQLSVPIFR